MNHVLIWDLGVGNVLIELFVLILVNLSLVSVPDRSQIVQDLSIKLNRVSDELREFLNDLLQLTLSRELS
jgi:hypothetical protein